MPENLEKLLGKLGLTEYESRVLNALFKQGEAEAPEISIAAGVPKTRVYDVLERLNSKQIIIPISGRPKKYKAIDAKKVIDLLLKEKSEELDKLRSETELMKSILESNVGDDYSEKVVKVKDKRDFIRLLAQEFETAEQSIIGFSHMDIDHAEMIKDSVRKAAEKKVNVMLIPNKELTQKKVLEELCSTSKGVTCKGYDHSLNAYVIDDSKVILGISDIRQDKPEYHFTIWRDNPAMAGIIKNHFDSTWKKAK